jgi:hypothetical protein
LPQQESGLKHRFGFAVTILPLKKRTQILGDLSARQFVIVAGFQRPAKHPFGFGVLSPLNQTNRFDIAGSGVGRRSLGWGNGDEKHQ